MPKLQLILQAHTLTVIYIIKPIERTPSSAPHGTLFWKKCAQQSIFRDKYISDPA